MNSLRWLLWAGLTIYTLYSVLVYLSRRGDNKSAYKRLRSATQPLRSLSPEERAALQPFLVDPLHPKKTVALVQEEVFALTGDYLQHGISTNHGGKTLHDTLGGVEVLLPYDARDHLDAYNTAEVVLTPKFAIVIKLNNTFDLMGGRERAMVKQQQDEQWASGRPGELPDVPMAPEPGPDRALPGVELLGQREETEAERQQRSTPGIGMLAALALLSGLGALGVASSSMPALSLPWLLAGGLLLVLAAWLAWRRPRLRQAGKVNRVRGPLIEVSVVRPGGSGIALKRLFLGDKFPLSLPDHWQQRLGALPGRTVEVEMRVDDCSVVRYGAALSIDEEMRRHPPVYWGRHLTLALAAGAALLVFLLFNESIVADAAQLKAHWMGAEVRDLSNASEALRRPPVIGQLVHLKAQARCSIVKPLDGKLPEVDCTRLRWGEPAKALAPYEVDPRLQPLLDGSFVQAQSSPQLDIMLSLRRAVEMRAHPSADPLAMYMPQPSLKIIPSITALVDRIAAFCGPNAALHAGASACASLQRAILEDAMLGEMDPAPANWDALLAAKQEGRLKGENDVAVTSDVKLASWRGIAKGMADELIVHDMRSRLQALEPWAGGGMTLLMPEPQARPSGNDDPIQRWQAYADTFDPKGARSLDLTGMVVASQRADGGGQVLQIDAQRNPDTSPVAAVRVFVALAALAVLLASSVLFAWRLSQALRRAKDIATLCDARLRTAHAELTVGF